MATNHSLRVSKQSFTWLITSKEHTNFSYDLTDSNKQYLAWFVAQVARISRKKAADLIAELESDIAFRELLYSQTRQSPRKHLMDKHIHFGRRLGWYALVRALEPEVIVETGTDRGLGTAVLALAATRNGAGRVYTIDVNADSGSLFRGTHLEQVVTRLTGSSLELINQLPSDVDFFIHDSDHAAAYERAELDAVETKLSRDSLAITDNAEATNVLSSWAAETGREFLYWQESPKNHWWPGGGIGVAWRP